MKWIGQNIYDLVARFRNDVYLEDISTGTIASGGNLGLDSNNKIVKATEASGDLTSIVAGTGLSGTSLTGPIPTLNVDASLTHVTGVGTITTGAWTGTAIASAYLDADTAHLTTAQTFTGSKTMATDVRLNFRDANSYIHSRTANDLDIVATDVALQADTTVTGNFTVNGDNVTFESVNADDPLVTIKNTSNDANDMARLNFVKDRGAAPAIGDNVAEIRFMGEDSGQNEQQYGFIFCETDVVTHGQESGKLSFGVANHDGGNLAALILTGGSADNETDVTIGLGAASVTTVTGTLTMGSTAAMDNAGLLTVGAQTGITACSNLVTVGTIGTGVWQGTAIAHAYIGNDAIDGDNIADDAVDSEHYTDGSIDTAHIADDQVTFAKASGVTPSVYGSIIKLLPSDFVANIDGGNTKLGVGYTDAAGSAYGMKVGSANAELFAFVSIPEGMKATHVDVFDKDDRALEVFEVQINATSLTSKGSGNCNTTLDITDVNATATNFLAIKITTTATTDKVFGGQVTIAAQ